jgi:hypothetical protein
MSGQLLYLWGKTVGYLLDGWVLELLPRIEHPLLGYGDCNVVAILKVNKA